MVNNPSANEGDIGDAGLIPGSGRSLEEGMATPFHILAWRIPAGQRPSERLLLQVWGCTYYTLLPPSPPNPKLNHGESRRTSQLRRKMPKKLDHVQFRSKHTPRLVGTGADSTAPRRPWKSPAVTRTVRETVRDSSHVCNLPGGTRACSWERCGFQKSWHFS